MSETDKPWTAEKVNENVHLLRFKDVGEGWNQTILLTGDRHHDNVMSNHKLELEHLKRARELNAPVIDIGDFFCAMQGKYDKRKSYTALRPEHTGDAYFDLLLDEAEEFYAPYADLFTIIGKGNHESSVLKKNQVNLTKNVVRRLRQNLSLNKENVNPFAGKYAGWVFLRFHIHKTATQTLRLKYHHGYGGGGPVTKGVIQTNRRAVYLPDADIIVTGHIHEAWVVPIMRERVNRAGTISIAPQWHISLPTYKEEYLPQDGFHIEGGRPPKPVGCVWLNLRFHNGGIKIEPLLDI